MTTPTALTAIHRAALNLVTEAQRCGVVVTIETTPHHPLAMGNHDMSVSVREARRPPPFAADYSSRLGTELLGIVSTAQIQVKRLIDGTCAPSDRVQNQRDLLDSLSVLRHAVQHGLASLTDPSSIDYACELQALRKKVATQQEAPAAEDVAAYAELPADSIGPFDVTQNEAGQDCYDHMDETWNDAKRWGVRLYAAEQMRAFADATHALRQGLAAQEPQQAASLMQREIALMEKAAKHAGITSLLNHGAASCVYSEGCAGVSQEHLLAYTREIALHCVLTLAAPQQAALDARTETAMVDAAMVEMANIDPPLKRRECARLIHAAFAAQGTRP